MRKRIFGFMAVNIIVAIVLAAAFSVVVLQARMNDMIKNALGTERVTIITDTGEVIFDNYAYTGALDNHLDRPEVQDAFRFGVGRSERFSDSLMERSYYHAMRLQDGTVLRLSLTAQSVYNMYSGLLPLFVLCAAVAVAVAAIAARILAARITEPINALDLNRDEIETYDELAPLIGRITTQKREISAQMSALEHRANTIKTITDNMTEGFIMTDREGLVLSANKSAQEAFGQLGEMSLNGRYMIELCRDRGFLAAMERCLSGAASETTLTRKGSVYSVFCTPVQETGAVILLLDITAKTAAERQRREFTANVSHELKTPLTTILGLVEMLENGMVYEAQQKSFIAKIGVQTRRLSDIVADIIRLSEFDELSSHEIRGQTEFTDVGVRQTVEKVFDALQEKAEQCGVTLSLEGEETIVKASAQMLDEMVYNLVDNGIKYTDAGGGVRVEISRDQGSCLLKVSDTGQGIAPEHLPHIFERFYTVSKSRTGKKSGTGLGLAIVKHICELHKAEVWAKSDKGVGTVITVRLPV